MTLFTDNHHVTDLLRDERVRRQALNGMGLLAGLGAGVAGYAFLGEPLNIELERLTIRLNGAEGRLPARGLRILHLSDTHFQGRNWREHAKIDRIRRLTQHLGYDLLIHTGDFLHYDSGLPNVLALLDALPRPRIGAYAVFGNHDYTHYAMGKALLGMWRKYQAETRAQRQDAGAQFWNLPMHMLRFGPYVRNTPVEGKRTGSNNTVHLAEALEERGFQVIQNEAIRLQRRLSASEVIDIYLAGVDDVTEGRPRLQDALNGVPVDAPTILLSHNPDILQSPRIGQVDLVLSGHTHGGQIVLPFWGPAHTQAHYLERRDVSGYLRRGRTQVYITRGIGEGIPLRFAARPQLALITVKAGASDGA